MGCFLMKKVLFLYIAVGPTRMTFSTVIICKHMRVQPRQNPVFPHFLDFSYPTYKLKIRQIW